MKLTLVQQMLQARQAKQPFALLTWLDNGRECLLRLDASEDTDGDTGGADLPADFAAQIRQAILDDNSGLLETESGRVFVHVFQPPLRLLVVGAVHIAQALIPVARLLGYQITLIDPRQAWAAESRFAGVSISTQWPDEALLELAPDTRTAIVTLSHDPKLDDPALKVALDSPAFYIGALGSRRTHATRLQRLQESGLEQAALARIHAPIGLDIGAKSPAEIALSIMAELTQTLRRGGAT